MKEIFIILGVVLIVINLLFVFPGILDSDRARCSNPKTRIELIVPGYAAGCWLGKPL